MSLFRSLLLALPVLANAQIPDDLTLDPVPGVSGLNAPLGIRPAGDASGRLFIVEQGGTIRVIDDDGTLLATSFIDLGDRVASGGELGLLDIAFHPEFSLNGRFYLHYSAGSTRPVGTAAGDTVVAEFTVSDDPNVGSSTPDRTILTVAQDFPNHNGGQMRFGPGGYLYLALGDGGSGNDPCNRAQTLDPENILTSGDCRSDRSVALLGKMLRVDVDNTTPASTNNLCGAGGNGSAEYAVPSENPFSGQPDRCGEVLLYGLRNPWRWSFDRRTSDLWIGDVGQNTWEEINLLEWPLAGGENLGWRICEAGFARGSTGTPCPLTGSVLAVLEYRNDADNCSVTGGYRYRGPVASLRGRYVFGDFCSGNVWLAREQDGAWQAELFTTIGNIRSFGEDETGNLYVLSGSTLMRFDGDVDIIFADGFESSS